METPVKVALIGLVSAVAVAVVTLTPQLFAPDPAQPSPGRFSIGIAGRLSAGAK